ncbi:uncharacterized protein LOC119598581 isoform X2 [Penaeus monodon]|uniref:uncharacterized protein LOC119598581 isoform X2 n=1 Tax=Penaeus monodon TaxID=6687 RepID=UPI0018A76E9B|nr:uncharacterized protein LOC119598581 isoform X2 [Penaeus monodon]
MALNRAKADVTETFWPIFLGASSFQSTPSTLSANTSFVITAVAMNPELEQWVQRNSILIKEEDRFSIRQLKTRTKHEDKENKVRVLAIGPEKQLEVKSVLLLGETGAGKTLFLNAFLNRLFGVTAGDKTRLQLKDQMDRKDKKTTQSQTDYTTAYIIYHQEGMSGPYNYMIIDTPGLGDTEGTEKDKINEQCLRFYLTDEKWISHINSVGLVWKGSEHRYDERKREILNRIKQLLGFDIKPFTDILLTFTTDRAVDAVKVVEASGIGYNQVFNFDNKPLYECPAMKTREDQMHRLMWLFMEESHGLFLEELNRREGVNLKITARLILTQMRLEDLQRQQQMQRQRKANISSRVQQHEGEMCDLEEEATRVDWDKIEDLDTSREIIVLDDGRHCHYCKKCDKTCIPACGVFHKAAVAPVKEGESVGETILGVVEKVGALGSALGFLSVPVRLASAAVSICAEIGRTIMFLIQTKKSKEKTEGLHASEGRNKCTKCDHLLLDHEVRDKVMAKDATWDQKMNLLKKLKYEEIMGKKSDLEAKIASCKAELESINKQKKQDDGTLKAYEREIKKLRMGK